MKTAKSFGKILVLYFLFLVGLQFFLAGVVFLMVLDREYFKSHLKVFWMVLIVVMFLVGLKWFFYSTICSTFTCINGL